MTKTICIYHAECTDGAASAAVVNRKFPDCQMVAMKHGDPIPVDVSGARVFIVDFSFSADVLNDIQAKAKELHWYDHHKTAVPTQQDLGFGTLDLNESGASLTWKMLFPHDPVPPIIAYVRDKDLWLWELPDSREISVSLGAMDEHMDPKNPIWPDLFAKSLDDLRLMRDDGRRLLKQQRANIEKGCKRAFELTFHGHRALAVNWTNEASAFGEYIYKDLGYDIAIIFFYDGGHWKFSLRSNRIDVSAIAQTYGGGGHPGAAGFRSDDIGWLLAQKKC